MLTATMNPQDAMAMTFRVFGLRVDKIAEKSGVSKESISRYKNKHRDLTASNALAIIKALPPQAREFYLSLLMEEEAQVSFVVKQSDEGSSYIVSRD